MATGDRQLRIVNWSGFVFALLQSACTAVMAISGVRFMIGIGTLAAAAGSNSPARGFHQDAIRIPMMIIAFAGSVINLYVLWRIRTLRARPASQWRKKPVDANQRRGEAWQIALSILTLILLAAELITHRMIHRS